MQSKYDSYSGDSTSNDYDNEEIRFSPYTTVQGEFEYVFGTGSEYGQSLGVVMENLELLDGAYYYYPAKDRYKLVSWKEEAGLTPYEAIDRDMEITADDADLIRTESYGGSTQQYELVAARAPRVEDEDGNVVVEATSKRRDVEFSEGDLDFTDWEDMEGATIELPRAITWYNGSDDYGPSAAGKSMLETITRFGSEAVVDEDDIYNWLPDASGDNLLREDLKGRRIEFFIVTRDSDNGYTYNVPVVEDVKTGERITPMNRDSGSDDSPSDTGGDSEPDAVTEAKEADSGSYPEPIADFISSGRNLNMNEERAGKLLDELIADADNSLTEGMIADNGGRENIIQEVV
jgi:hypothetical protein